LKFGKESSDGSGCVEPSVVISVETVDACMELVVDLDGDVLGCLIVGVEDVDVWEGIVGCVGDVCGDPSVVISVETVDACKELVVDLTSDVVG